MNHVSDRGPDPPWEAAILGGKGRSIVNCEKKRLNRSRRRLGYGLGWAQGIMC